MIRRNSQHNTIHIMYKVVVINNEIYTICVGVSSCIKGQIDLSSIKAELVSHKDIFSISFPAPFFCCTIPGWILHFLWSFHIDRWIGRALQESESVARFLGNFLALEITLYWGKFESITACKGLVMNGERDEYYKYCHESNGQGDNNGDTRISDDCR